MLFNSIDFLIFFPVVTILYFLLPHRFRWIWLLGASAYFYMAFIPYYILILLLTITVDYIAGIQIARSEGKRRKRFLAASIVANVGILFFFKYFNFFSDNLHQLSNFLHWNYPIGHLGIILPIGLSFHTFQAMSYTIEVYRGHQEPERNFGIFSLYVLFYPQLVAGPIERPQNLLHQFYEPHRFDYARVTSGLKRMAWGMFKKVVIADRLAVFVDAVYNNPGEHSGFPLLIATYFFAFQIYCDFSGYSDIALGAAQVMGFKLMENFNRPYFSKSIAEFWKRWHISLSTWFRDYLYIPLGGNRVPRWRWYMNLFTVFLVSGFWHGANWTYIIWGALHGFYLVFGIWSYGIREKIITALGLGRSRRLLRWIRIVITFHLVTFAWIFFRANSLANARYIVSNIFKLRLSDTGIDIIGPDEFVVAILAIIFMETIHSYQRRGSLKEMLSARPAAIRWLVYYAIIMAIILFGHFTSHTFIYFQF